MMIPQAMMGVDPLEVAVNLAAIPALKALKLTPWEFQIGTMETRLNILKWTMVFMENNVLSMPCVPLTPKVATDVVTKMACADYLRVRRPLATFLLLSLTLGTI